MSHSARATNLRSRASLSAAADPSMTDTEQPEQSARPSASTTTPATGAPDEKRKPRAPSRKVKEGGIRSILTDPDGDESMRHR